MYEPGAPFLDDLNRLRKRNKNLEHAVKQLRNERQVLLRGENERKAQQEMVVTAVAEEAKGLMDAMKMKYEARIMELEGDQTAIVENRVRVALEALSPRSVCVHRNATDADALCMCACAAD